MKKIMKTILLLVVVTFINIGCGSIQLTSDPPKPPTMENEALSYLLDAGCESINGNSVKCNDLQIEIINVCDQINKAPDELVDALKESDQIATCLIKCASDNYEKCQEIKDSQEYVYKWAGFNTYYYRYLIIRNNEFHMLNNKIEFYQYFGEITYEEEALALVVGLNTNGRPLYNFDEYIEHGWSQISAEVRGTQVTIEDNLFIINLFYSTDACQIWDGGALYERKLSVDTSGNISVIEDNIVFDSLNESTCLVD